MLSRSVLTCALVAGLLAGAGAPARSQEGRTETGIGVRLLEAPLDRRDDPRARRFVVDHVAPGATVTRRFEVSNDTDRAATLDLYPVAAELREGSFVPAPGRQANELSSWITVTPATLDLGPRSTAQASLSIRVPATATAGERYAAVLAERPPDPGAAIGVASRVGIRIYLSVGPGGEPDTDFDLVTFAPKRSQGGAPAVDVETCNRGGRAIDVAGELELTDGPGGTRAGPFKTTGNTTVAPGGCETVTIGLDDELPRGPWKATVTLRSGNRARQATATITFPVSAGATAQPVEADEVTGTDRGRFALAIALALLLLVLAVLAWLLWRRRHQAKKDAADGDGTSG